MSQKKFENCTRIQRCVYIVRTQAGFKKALKQVINDDLSAEPGCVENYPKSYPSLVIFGAGHRGYHYVHCTCFHLNFLHELLQNHDAKPIEEELHPTHCNDEITQEIINEVIKKEPGASVNTIAGIVWEHCLQINAPTFRSNTNFDLDKAVVHCNTEEAVQSIKQVMAERNWPCSPRQAARAGWEACLRTNAGFLFNNQSTKEEITK